MIDFDVVAIVFAVIAWFVGPVIAIGWIFNDMVDFNKRNR